MTWKIGYYKKENGEIPVLDFLLTLEPKMRAKVVQYIDLLEKTPSSELERALKYKLDFERRGTDE